MNLTRLSWTVVSVVLACGGRPSSGAVGCRRHIDMYPAEYFAAELGAEEVRTVRNLNIPLWSGTLPEGQGRKVGEIPPGSFALIVGEGPADFKIRSPLDGSVGWITKRYVRRTPYLDVETGEPCTP